MEIINRTACKTPQRSWFGTTIQTDFQPSEIIALRSDGTSESTDPEAALLRQGASEMHVISEYLRGRAELEPEVKRLCASINDIRLHLNAQSGKEAERAKYLSTEFTRQRQENARLESELKAANDELQALKADVNYSTFIEVASERDQLKRQLERLEEKRELKERLQGEVLRLETLRDVRQALGCTFGDVVAAARGMVQHDTKMCQIICRISDKIGCRSDDVETGVANLFDGYNTQHAELSQAKAELQRKSSGVKDCGLALGMDAEAACYTGYVEKRALQVMCELERLKTTYSMDRVHGMPLDEVRMLKAERDGLKNTEYARLRQLEMARQGETDKAEKLRKVGAILGANICGENVTQAAANIVHELSSAKHNLDALEQNNIGLRNLLHDRDAKLDAVTRALSG